MFTFKFLRKFNPRAISQAIRNFNLRSNRLLWFIGSYKIHVNFHIQPIQSLNTIYFHNKSVHKILLYFANFEVL